MSTHEIREPDPGRATAEDLLVHAAWVRRLARSLVADAATADDLVQDTWIAAMRRPPRVDQPLGPWLARVVRNLAHGRHRGETRRVKRESARFVERHEPGADEIAGSLEMQRLLIDMVEELGEPQRSTLVRHYFHGKTSAEIALEDGVADGTVRWRLKQAIDELKARLDARHDGDRRAWALMLAPLADRADVGVPATSIAAGAAVGGLIMAVWIKVLVAVTVLIAVATLTWTVVRTPVPETPAIAAQDAPRAQIVLDPIAEAEHPEVRHVRESMTAQTAEPAKAEAPVVVPANSAVVEARVLNANGAPLAGARLTCTDKIGTKEITRAQAPFAVADATGVVRLTLGADDVSKKRGRSVLASADSWSMELELSAPSRAPKVERITLVAGSRHSLGDVVLPEGGDVSGRIVDTAGNPLAGVEVRLVLPELTLEERDQAAAAGLHKKDQKGFMKSGSDGTFVLGTIPIGFYRAWTNMRGREHVVTEPFEVRAGPATALPDIILRENERAVRGIVLGLDGAPAVGAELENTYRDEDGEARWIGGDRTDEQGRFVIEGFSTPTIDIYVLGPWPKRDKGSWDQNADRGQTILRAVKAGTRDVVLQLRTTPLTRVIAKTPEGGILDRIWLGAIDPRGNGTKSTSIEPPHNVRVLAKRCLVYVKAEGFAEKRLGPFEAATAPAVLEVTLAHEAQITGRVTADGGPPSRTYVTAHRVLPAGRTLTSFGFPLRLDPDGPIRTQSSKEGTFAFALDETSRWVVVVQAQGFATWESDVLDVGSKQGKKELEVVLGHGGSLEGTVIERTSNPSEPAYVTLSRGFGAVASTRVDADGKFRVTDLAPGAWVLRMTPMDLLGMGNVQKHAPPDPANREIQIAAGQMTRIELDMRAYTAPTLSGRIAFQGVDVQGWTASIDRPGETYMEWISVPVDEHGVFQIVAEEVGAHRLKLSSKATPERSETIEQDVELKHGTTTWSLDAATGSVKIPSIVSGDLVLRWKSSSGARWTAHVRKASGAELLIDRVPTGIVRLEGPGHPASDVTVRAEEVALVDWR